MRSTFLLFIISIFLFISGSTQAVAQEDEGSLSSGTIESQYNYLWESSNRYQDHRVVKVNKLNKFKVNVLDSLNSLHKTINELETTISNQNMTRKNLDSEKDSLAISLQSAITEKENFSILGTDMSKSSFKSLFWIITSILAFLTIFSIIRLNSKMSIAKEAKSGLIQLEEEFEDYKKKSREKEQVLARQLQDEINKNL